MSNKTRQNNTREQIQKMESKFNDSPEIPDRRGGEGGDIRRARPPFGPKWADSKTIHFISNGEDDGIQNSRRKTLMDEQQLRLAVA